MLAPVLAPPDLDPHHRSRILSKIREREREREREAERERERERERESTQRERSVSTSLHFNFPAPRPYFSICEQTSMDLCTQVPNTPAFKSLSNLL
jgi:hypothetical protein